MIKALAAGLSLMLLGLLAATFYMGWRCGQLAWWPFQVHQWYLSCAAWSPQYQFHSMMIFLAFSLAGGLAGAFFRRGSKDRKKFGSEAWATLDDVIKAGLIMKPGQRSKVIRVIGKFGKHILTYTGKAHLLVFMGNRSGKGRGIGVPTALSFADAITFHDPKGELFWGDPTAEFAFPGTAGFRAALGHRVVYFNPTDPRSARYNPLLGIRKGRHEIRDLQSLIVILFGGAPRDFWEKGGSRLLMAIGLHILYAEPNSEKNLAGMGRFLDLGDDGLLRVIAANAHPKAAQAARSFFPGGIGSDDAEKTKGMRAGLYVTARNFLNPFDDETVEEVTSGLSHFEPADLVRHEKPTDLYLVMPASDQELDSIILSLIISQILRELMGPRLDTTVGGHLKKHKVLLFLDEVAALGKMGDFAKKLPQMPGHGISALLIYQSSKQLNVTFGTDSGISENFDATIAAATSDEGTAKWLSSMAGNVSEREVVVSRSKPAGALLGGTITTSEREIFRPLLDSGDVFQLSEDDEYIFRKSHKPIQCKKLKYYEEEVFQNRLLPAPPIGDGDGNYPGLTPIPSPWWGLSVSPELLTSTESIGDIPDPDGLDFNPDDWMQQLETEAAQ